MTLPGKHKRIHVEPVKIPDKVSPPKEKPTPQKAPEKVPDKEKVPA